MGTGILCHVPLADTNGLPGLRLPPFLDSWSESALGHAWGEGHYLQTSCPCVKSARVSGQSRAHACRGCLAPTQEARWRGHLTGSCAGPREGALSYSQEASPERHPCLDNLRVLAYYYSLFQRGQMANIKKTCLLLCPCSAPCPPSVHGPTTPRWAVSPRMQVTGWASGPLLNACLCSEINSMRVSRYIRSTKIHMLPLCAGTARTHRKSPCS